MRHPRPIARSPTSAPLSVGMPLLRKPCGSADVVVTFLTQDPAHSMIATPHAATTRKPDGKY